MEEINNKSNPLRGSIVTALCLFILDSLILGQGAIAIFALIAVVFWMLPKTLFAWKRKQLLINRALKLSIYTVMVAAILIVNVANNHLAGMRAEQLIISVNTFNEQYQRYPVTLDELVPGLITVIPKAKYTLMFNNFIYTNMEGHATLMYFDFPPFGRPYYDFNKQEWGYID